jgi:ABC-2 type transport system permease protein
MRILLAIALKDLRVLTRHRPALFWVVGFPLLMAFFFGAIYAGGGGGQHAMKIAVVDLDRSDFSRKFTAELMKSDALLVIEAPYDSARVLVRQGRYVAYVALPPGIGETLGFGGADSTSGLEVGIDPSRRAEQGYLRGILTQAVFGAMQGQFGPGGGGRAMIERALANVRADSTRTPAERARQSRFLSSLDEFMTTLDSNRTAMAGSGADSGRGFSGPRIRMVPVTENEDGPRNAWEITFPAAMLWALVGVCSTFAISIVSERTRGTFLRLRLAPISRAQVLAGKGLAAFLAGVTVTTALILLGIVLCHIRVSHPAQLAAAIVAATICFAGLTTLVSTLGKDERAVAGAAWGVLLLQSMTGGAMIPLIAMPPWLLTVSHWSMVKWGILAVEGAIWRDFTWGEMALPIVLLVGVGAVGFALGSWILSRSDT